MRNLWQRLLSDETGLVVSSELALVGTVGVLGMVVGLESVATAVTQELTDLSNAYRSLNQSYSYRSVFRGNHGRISGSSFTDLGANGGGLGTSDVNGQFANSQTVQTNFAGGGNGTNSIRLIHENALDAVEMRLSLP
jgi:Flp pilus assembly pilin Flp